MLLLLRNDGVPEVIPAVGEYVIGETRVTHPFRTVRLWEMDPDPVLATKDPKLLSWALLMRLGREEAEKLGAQIGGSGSEEHIARFLTLGSLRYDREELVQMMGGPRMSLEEAIVEGSWIFQDAKKRATAEALAIGEARGEVKGHVAEARRSLRLALAARFPGNETIAEIDHIGDLSVLQDLLVRTIQAQDRESVVKAIAVAATGAPSA